MTFLFMIYLLGMIITGLVFGLSPHKGARLRIIICCMMLWPIIWFNLIRDYRKEAK